MQQHQVPAAPVLSVAETLTHPHHVARGTVRTITDPVAGSFQIPGMPLRFSKFPDDLPLEAPTLGQHNAEVLRDWLGMSEQEIASLESANVLQAGEY
jgi:crotonobetainyl-CoA:carnitine CoA-transferase CaiB-like acyl-CoA transferase